MYTPHDTFFRESAGNTQRVAAPASRWLDQRGVYVLIGLVFFVSRSGARERRSRELTYRAARICLAGSRREHHLFNVTASTFGLWLVYVRVSGRRKEGNTGIQRRKTTKKKLRRIAGYLVRRVL